MVRIYKDTDVKVVTHGAYEKFYKPLGYELVIDAVVAETTTEIKEETVTEEKKETPKTKNTSNRKKNKEEE